MGSLPSGFTLPHEGVSSSPPQPPHSYEELLERVEVGYRYAKRLHEQVWNANVMSSLFSTLSTLPTLPHASCVPQDLPLGVLDLHHTLIIPPWIPYHPRVPSARVC